MRRLSGPPLRKWRRLRQCLRPFPWPAPGARVPHPAHRWQGGPGGQGGEALHAQHGRGVEFGNGRENGPHPQVVHQGGVHGAELVHVGDGQPQDFVRADHGAHGGYGKVPLADVDAVRIQRQRQVNAVVDNEGDAARRQEIPDGQGFPVAGARVRIGGAVLHDGDAAVHGLPDGFQQAVAAFGRFVSDQVEVEVE